MRRVKPRATDMLMRITEGADRAAAAAGLVLLTPPPTAHRQFDRVGCSRAVEAVSCLLRAISRYAATWRPRVSGGVTFDAVPQ
jgi:hypothetical protein